MCYEVATGLNLVLFRTIHCDEVCTAYLEVTLSYCVHCNIMLSLTCICFEPLFYILPYMLLDTTVVSMFVTPSSIWRGVV